MYFLSVSIGTQLPQIPGADIFLDAENLKLSSIIYVSLFDYVIFCANIKEEQK
jgi:hypothetical protein